MIDKKEVLGMIFFTLIVGVIALLTVLMSINEATIADLKRINDSQNAQIMNLDYQLKQCKILHVEGYQLHGELK